MTKFAFVFPGQGSQSMGMMDAYAQLPIVRNTFAEASDILGSGLWSLVSEPARADDLNLTINTQPVMLTAGVAVYRAWLAENGATPALLAGHSLGEYTALVAAGVLSLADALPLVRFRAQCMQQAVPEGVGAMAAILGLEDDAIRQLCAQAAQDQVLEAANFNSPGQVVIAGDRAAVERGMAAAKELGAKRAVMLPMSVPSHCSLQRGAAEKLAAYLENVAFNAPTIPVLHNADVVSYNDPAAIKDALVRQLYSPVRWVETLLAMGQQGVTHNVECGPGKVLVGLNKRIDKQQQALSIHDTESLKAALTTLV